MLKKATFLIILTSFCIVKKGVAVSSAVASVTALPVNKMVTAVNFEQLLSLAPKGFEKLTGRHLSFKEKIGYRFLQWKLRRQARLSAHKTDTGTKAERHSKNALVYGIVTWGFTLLGLALPVIGLLAIPASIAAIIFGAISLNKTKSNTRSILGMVLGGLYLILIIIGLAVFL